MDKLAPSTLKKNTKFLETPAFLVASVRLVNWKHYFWNGSWKGRESETDLKENTRKKTVMKHDAISCKEQHARL